MDTQKIMRPDFQDEQETLPIFRAPVDDEDDTLPTFNMLPFCEDE